MLTDYSCFVFLEEKTAATQLESKTSVLCLVMVPAGGAGVAGMENESINRLIGNSLISYGCGQLVSYSYTVSSFVQMEAMLVLGC